jgi:small basic protein
MDPVVPTPPGEVTFPIEDVNSATAFYLKANWYKHAFVGLIFLVVVALGLMFFDAYAGVPFSGNAYWIAICLVIFIVGDIAMVRQKMMHEFMRQFAQSNGYQYARYGSTMGLTGQFFGLGHSHYVQDLVSGNYNNRPLQIFEYGYTVGSGKNQHSYKYTVGRITFDAPLPKIIMSVDHHDFGGEFFGIGFKQESKLNLEGDFDNFFDVSVEKEFEIEALQIFTQQFMDKIKTDYKNFALEAFGNDLYIYSYNVITNKTALLNLFGYSKFLTDTLEPVLQRLKSSINAMREAQVS